MRVVENSVPHSIRWFIIVFPIKIAILGHTAAYHILRHTQLVIVVEKSHCITHYDWGLIYTPHLWWKQIKTHIIYTHAHIYNHIISYTYIYIHVYIRTHTDIYIYIYIYIYLHRTLSSKSRIWLFTINIFPNFWIQRSKAGVAGEGLIIEHLDDGGWTTWTMICSKPYSWIVIIMII